MEEKSEPSGGLTFQEKTLTETQDKYLNLLKTQGSIGRASKVAGVHYTTVRETLQAVAKKLGMNSHKDLVLKYGFASPVHKKPEKQKRLSLVKQIVSIIEKQEFRCALSGVFLNPDSSNLDHKHPVSLGGTDDIENLQWLDSNVNRAKGNMPNEEFILMCKRVAAWCR
jgi:5-methylcytosine-specific restriction endonuclease McrA